MKKNVCFTALAVLITANSLQARQPREMTYLARERAKKRKLVLQQEAMLKQQAEQAQKRRTMQKPINPYAQIKPKPAIKAVPKKVTAPMPIAVPPIPEKQPTETTVEKIQETTIVDPTDTLTAHYPVVAPPKAILSPNTDAPYKDPNNFYWIKDGAEQVWWSTDSKQWKPWIENNN